MHFLHFQLYLGNVFSRGAENGEQDCGRKACWTRTEEIRYRADSSSFISCTRAWREASDSATVRCGAMRLDRVREALLSRITMSYSGRDLEENGT